MKELEPGPELDALLAEKVMGWKRHAPDWKYTIAWESPEGRIRTTKNEILPGLAWSPSTRIQDAEEVLNKLNLIGYRPEDGYNYMLGRDVQGERPFWCLYREEGMADENWMEEASPRGHDLPHAICLAALAAVGYSEEHARARMSKERAG